jgi:hypothetical protein
MMMMNPMMRRESARRRQGEDSYSNEGFGHVRLQQNYHQAKITRLQSSTSVLEDMSAMLFFAGRLRFCNCGSAALRARPE